ncbi:hypothetical protein [Propionivibrio dicarboxylicus]|uniref:Uncharacterized protein n=1 Tax=Propionivibrio dicarboxylicus TaxID=83767 RepID=A0A1G8GZD5_9RHOO|nr:hypothetical protein [Propionivibrio dicarboxylicus]SDH99758.1 hypothetical protein SAMN05660652_02688 [Propionivibrio dicarboxylicus]
MNMLDLRRLGRGFSDVFSQCELTPRLVLGIAINLCGAMVLLGGGLT